jgi:two-component system, chemotaxis family, chemotaxis protein CheY
MDADPSQPGVGPVLVIDDDESIRDFLTTALTDEGYAVLTAANGQAALDLLADVSPGLILLDMRMPVMDGWEFARLYRQRPGPHAPLVVMTAARDAIDRASQIEADGLLAKPFDLDDLLAVVARFTGVGRPSG